MASTSETGHAKNVANFKTLVTFITSLGDKYNPSKANIKLAALEQISTKASASMEVLAAAQPAYNEAVNEQKLTFQPLDKLVTRVVSGYKASVDNPSSAAAVISIKKRMTASGVKKEIAKDGEEQKPGRSVSQRSYDKRLENFDALIKMAAATGEYAPSEEELKVTTLKALYDDLFKKTNEVDAAEAPLVNNRKLRDQALYTPLTGALDIVDKVKDYVISVYGSGSPEIRYLNRLTFRTPTK